MVRTFICVEINEPNVLKSLEAQIYILSKLGIRTSKLQQLHLTLKFLGEISDVQIERIKNQLQKVSSPQFSIQLMGMGCFPNLNYMRVVWIGISEGAEMLKNLSAQIEDFTYEEGFLREKRGFSPHLTLARISKLSPKNKSTLQEHIKENRDIIFGTQLVSQVILKKSDLTPQGAIYSDLLKVPLQ